MDNVRGDPGHYGPVVAALESFVAKPQYHWRHNRLRSQSVIASDDWKEGWFYLILFPSNGLTFFVHLQQGSAVVRSHGEEGRYLVVEVPLQAAGKVVDDALQNVGLVVLRFGVNGERFQLLQAGLEGVMLVHVGLEEAGLAHDLLEARKHERFFQVVMVTDPVRPGSDEE